MLPLLATLSPNAAILILTIGIGLIALELNRPGSVVPGALGLLLTLLAAASLSQRQPNLIAVVGSIVSMAFLLLQTRRTIHLSLLVALTVLLIGCFIRLLPHSVGGSISPTTATLCGSLLAVGTTVLTRIARRARQNKGLD